MNEIDEMLESLPRVEKGPLNARVWLDASGQINILPEGGGWLGVPQETLAADLAFDPD